MSRFRIDPVMDRPGRGYYAGFVLWHVEFFVFFFEIKSHGSVLQVCCSFSDDHTRMGDHPGLLSDRGI